MNKKQMQEFMTALNNIVEEKGIDKAKVIEAMEQAMVVACKKKGAVKCKVNPDTGEIKLYSVRTVVSDEEFTDEKSQISMSSAVEIVPDICLGETIEREIEIPDFGRVAAGTAKQVIVQKMKEAEKELIEAEYGDKQDELLIGTLAREDARTYYVDLGKTFGLLPKNEIIPGEKLEMGSQVRVYASKVEMGNKGVFILLSRSHYGFLKRLLELEIPEINDGTVILYSVAREAGVRSKVSVYTEYDNVEAVGCVIGANGSRINRVLKQLNGEKIDVVMYDKDPASFISNALSPAKNVRVFITDIKKKEAVAVVDKDNLSLAIGKKGQNVRLASKLTHFKIDVKCESDVDLNEYEKKYCDLVKIQKEMMNNDDIVEDADSEYDVVDLSDDGIESDENAEEESANA